MAKKSSAMSKGYRKTVKEKPFLTKKEIIALVAIIAAIVLGVVLFNIFYDDGFLGAEEVQTGDIVSFADAKIKNRYLKLGTINELDGFTMEALTSAEKPTGGYVFTPEDESDPLSYFTVGGALGDAASRQISTTAYWANTADSMSAPIETTIHGSAAVITSFTQSAYDENKEIAEPVEDAVAEPAADEAPVESEAPAEDEAPAENAADAEPEANTFYQFIYMYVDAAEGHSFSMLACRMGDDPSVYLPDDQLEAYMTELARAIQPIAAE